VNYRHHNLVGDEPLPYSIADGTPADRIFGSYSSWIEHREEQVGEVLAILAGREALPALYHCAGGKDRTGVISALLLELAGVAKETIAQDYGLTARYLWDRWQSEPPEVEGGAVLRDWPDYQREFCPPECMVKVLDFLEARYGGAEGFARSAGLGDRQIDSLRVALVE
jgi:protein-tyrosine phosphatase